MLVLLKKGIMKCTVDMGSGYMIYIPSFIKTDAGIQVILRSPLRYLKDCNAGITDGRDL
jgi:hypothetical protein